jgi:hypothetical protein
MWLRFDATTLWHFDAAEWVPSTTSKSGKPPAEQIASAIHLREDITAAAEGLLGAVKAT